MQSEKLNELTWRMTIVKNDSQFEVRDDLGIERLDDELLILDKKNEKIHRLNQTAAMVWEGLVAGRNSVQVASELVEVFDITVEVALQDVAKMMESFTLLNLIKPISASQESEN
jgi:hypothetical protein